MDVRAAQDKPDRGRVVSKSNMRAMKEVRGLDQAPQRWAGAAVQGMQPPAVGKHASSSNAVAQAGSTVDPVQRVAVPGNQQVHVGVAPAPVHVHVVKEVYPVPDPQPHVIVENDVLKIEEVKGPDHPKQKGIDEYLEEGTIRPEAGDQVVYRLKPVGGDPSAAALAEAGHITAGDPQLAVLGSPEVPVGVASALSYMQLGQTAKVKLSEQLLTHVAGDTEAGFNPLPEDIASSARDTSHDRPYNRSRDTTASPAGSAYEEKAVRSGTGSTGWSHDVLPGSASQIQQQQQQLGGKHSHLLQPGLQQQQQQQPGRGDVNIHYPHSMQPPPRHRSASPIGNARGPATQAALAAAAAAAWPAVQGSTAGASHLDPIPSDEALNRSGSNHSSWIAESRDSSVDGGTAAQGSAGSTAAAAAGRGKPSSSSGINDAVGYLSPAGKPLGAAAAASAAGVVLPGTGSSSTAGTLGGTHGAGGTGSTVVGPGQYTASGWSSTRTSVNDSLIHQLTGATHELQAVHRTAPASSTAVQQLPGRNTGAAAAAAAAAAAEDKDGYHTPDGSAFYTPLSITPAADSGSFSSLDNQAALLSSAGHNTAGLTNEQAGSSSSSHRVSGGGAGGAGSTCPRPPGSTGSTSRVNRVLCHDGQHESKLSQPSVNQAGVVDAHEPGAVLKAAAAKLQQQYGSTTEQQQQQEADKLSVQQHVRHSEQQHTLGKGGLSPVQQQQQQRSGSTTAGSAAGSTSNTSPAAATAAATATAAAAAKVTQQQQQQGYPEIEVLHKSVAPPAEPAAAAATGGNNSSSKAVPEVAALGQDQGGSSSSNSAWLKPVQPTAGHAAAAAAVASSGVAAAAAAARGGTDAPAPTAGWGKTAAIQPPLDAQQQQGADLAGFPPTGDTTNNGSSTAVAASWGKAVGEQQHQQQNLAQAVPSPNLGHAPDEPVKSDSPVIAQLPPRVNVRTGRPAAAGTAATGGPVSSSAVQTGQGRSSASYDAQSIASLKAWIGRPSQTSEPHTPTHGAAAAPARILAEDEHHTHDAPHKDCPMCGTAKNHDKPQQQQQQQQQHEAAAGGSSSAAAATSPAGDEAAGGDPAGSGQDKAVEYEVELLAVIPGRGKLSGKPILAEAAKQQPPDVTALTKTTAPHLQPPKPRRGLSGWVRRHLSLNVRAPWKAGKGVLGMLGLRGCCRGAQDKQE